MGNEKIDLISVAKPEKNKTLLERYGVPINNLSYEYISGCTNAKTLERIVLILRSGEEGVYPDLTRHAEERLARIKPASAILRKAGPVLRRNMLHPDERREIDDDLGDWMCEMRSREKDLNEGRAALTCEPLSQPEIRKTKPDVAREQRTKVDEKKRVKPGRIPSCDYAAWDKYDADTEINKIDLWDEQRQGEIKRVQERRKELDKMSKTAHKAAIDKLSLTGTELGVMAAEEREKGNEAFKAADYEEALRHYNISIQMDSNPLAYNNRAMTFIKLQRYGDALNDCNIVLSMDYMNVKALLRRALSLEHLEERHQALADYEAVLKLEPTNKTAISGVNKLRKPHDSGKIRMKIEEENISDVEDSKAEAIKSERAATTNSAECPKQRFSSEICFCDRAPGSSRDIASPKPHVKASYCVETKSGGETAAVAAAKRSDGKITRVFASGDKLSPVAKDFGRANKATKARDADALKGNDIAAISRQSFSGSSRGARSSLKKSIFSCVSSAHEGKLPPVIIEELPSGETCEKPREITDSGEVRAKSGIKSREGKYAPTEKSRTSGNKGLISPEKQSRTKTRSTSGKIQIANKYKKGSEQLEVDIQRLEHVESPYEFLRLWQSLKDDANLKLHAKLLRSIACEDMNKFIGCKLDATMFSLILRCLEQQFCTREDAHLLASLLHSLSRLNRFSIVRMFMDAEDKKALASILRFLEKEDSSRASQLRQIYVA